MRVLFVCLGNICRSPAGEAILKAKVLNIEVESCGLGDWHKGQQADLRMREAAKERGYHIDSIAYSFKPRFFDQFDLILAADRSVQKELISRIRKPADIKKLKLIGDYAPNYKGADIPDPYHGTIDDFHIALDMLEDACQGLSNQIQEGYGS